MEWMDNKEKMGNKNGYRKDASFQPQPADRLADLDWSFLDSFNLCGIEEQIVSLNWTDLDDWFKAAYAALEEQYIDLDKLATDWDKRLHDLGGDPCVYDWKEFRPLRLEREEDWSDWLAHILQTSKTGFLAGQLFGNAFRDIRIDFAQPKVKREVTIITGERRADLCIQWRNPTAATHVEVKIGDENFDKTFDTSIGLRRTYPDRTNWTHYILLPEASLENWKECQEHQRSQFQIDIAEITWTQIAIALRKGLRKGGEDILWRTCAYIFCGAIEQKILGHIQMNEETLDGKTLSWENFRGVASQLHVMKEGMNDG